MSGLRPVRRHPAGIRPSRDLPMKRGDVSRQTGLFIPARRTTCSTTAIAAAAAPVTVCVTRAAKLRTCYLLRRLPPSGESAKFANFLRLPELGNDDWLLFEQRPRLEPGGRSLSLLRPLEYDMSIDSIPFGSVQE